MENNKNKKSVKFQGDMLNFYDFIQVFVFTRNHHLISPGKLSQIPPAESLLIYLIYLSRHLNQACWPLLMHSGWFKTGLLSMPMGVDYVVLGFDMEVQPLVTHNAA